MGQKATLTGCTPEEFLAGVAAERRHALSAVRQVVLRNLPAGYYEWATRKMLMYSVPLDILPKTYNGQPLMYAALASQKNYLTLHLLPVYGNAALRANLEAGFREAGKKLDMGKGCIRFRKADDLALDALGRIVAATPVATFVQWYHASRNR